MIRKLVLILCLFLAVEASGQVVSIPDPNLRAAIEETLGKASGATITAADMARLTHLDARNANISNLTGLEHATNLTELHLGAEWVEAERTSKTSNSVSNLSPLEGLTNLTRLDLRGNNISDLSPLAGLTNLATLTLSDNRISDLSPLADLTNLTELKLNRNSISNLSPLSRLTNLATLLLQSNSSSNLSPLAGLTNLTRLGLAGNGISDISPLEGLTNLATLGLHGNGISDISPLAGLTNLTKVVLRYNNISDLSVLVTNTGLGNGDTVNVKGNPLNRASIKTHIPALQRRGVTVEFDNVIAEPVDIPDTNLRAKIAEALGKAPNATITTADMANLTELIAQNADITDLTGLEHATNLTWLILGTEYVQEEGRSINSNSVSDLSPLAGLTNLTWLGLDDNNISNISAVAGLTNLTELNLDGNNLSNISPLAGLTNLTWLGLDDNNISNISAVAGLTNLTRLGLDDNNISNISVVVGLTNLTSLLLANNLVSDLSPLVANTGLESGDWVAVWGNPLSDASINTHIPALRNRGVTVDDGTPTHLLKISGTITESHNLLIVEVRHEWRRLEGITVTFTVISGGGTLSLTNTMTDNKGRAESRLTLGAGMNTVHATVEGIAQPVIFSDVPEPAVDMPDPNLRAKIAEILEKPPGAEITESDMVRLTGLFAPNANISDLTGLEHATNLTDLYLGPEYIEAEDRFINSNSVSDISALAGLTNLTWLSLDNNNISDISALAGLTNLIDLELGSNNISDISAVGGLTNLRWLSLDDNNIRDISPLVTNTGVGVEWVAVSANPLNDASINTHIPALESRGVFVWAENLKPSTLEYHLSLPTGISLIHVPLKVTAVNNEAITLASISDLYDALGGAGAVTFLITYDTSTQTWLSYFSTSDTDTAADAALTDVTGIVANMKAEASVVLSGSPLGTNGNGAITLSPGLNLVGLPLRDSRINRVSDLLSLEGSLGNVSVIILAHDGDFKAVGRAGDPGDIPITGGQGFILTAQRQATADISGEGWTNDSTTAAAPVARMGIKVGNITPVLALSGAIVDESTRVNRASFRVVVKNLSNRVATSHSAAAAVDDAGGYRLTIVDIESARAAQVGNVLEISAQSPNPFVRVNPLRHTVTTEDVKRGLIWLPELVAYEIPAETELLHNYPNPFNPETWIPYHLALDADVRLTIYDAKGVAVRQLDLGYQPAGYYTDRNRAAYWDGRNDVGEQVSSGVYFYHLKTGDYSQTRKMLILK